MLDKNQQMSTSTTSLAKLRPPNLPQPALWRLLNIGKVNRHKLSWSNPEDSMGGMLGKKGDFTYWEVVGPAKKAYDKLYPRISELLADNLGMVDGSDLLLYQVYLIGRFPEKAIPHIMLSNPKRKTRTKAMKIIIESGILKEFPGMQVGEWVAAPHIGLQILMKPEPPSRPIIPGHFPYDRDIYTYNLDVTEPQAPPQPATPRPSTSERDRSPNISLETPEPQPPQQPTVSHFMSYHEATESYDRYTSDRYFSNYGYTMSCPASPRISPIITSLDSWSPGIPSQGLDLMLENTTGFQLNSIYMPRTTTLLAYRLIRNAHESGVADNPAATCGAILTEDDVTFCLLPAHAFVPSSRLLDDHSELDEEDLEGFTFCGFSNGPDPDEDHAYTATLDNSALESEGEDISVSVGGSGSTENVADPAVRNKLNMSEFGTHDEYALAESEAGSSRIKPGQNQNLAADENERIKCPFERCENSFNTSHSLKIHLETHNSGKEHTDDYIEDDCDQKSTSLVADNRTLTTMEARDIPLKGQRLVSRNLNYALFEADLDLKPEDQISRLTIDNVSAIPKEERPIHTVTASSGPIDGILTGESYSVYISGESGFRTVYVVNPDQPIRPGDCGSIVKDGYTGAIYGHIVTGSRMSNSGFIVPATAVLDDAIERLRRE